MTAADPGDPGRRAAVEAAADRLVAAAREGSPCPPVRELLPDGGLEDGYAVQQLVRARTGEGRRRVGRKVGLTSEAVQRQMGVDTPDLGVLFADMAYGDAEPIPHGRLLQPRIEAEVAFVLGADLPDHTVTPAEVLRAVDFVVPAIEVCDSRIRGWDISLFDTVADNASSGLYVLGSDHKTLTEVEPVEVEMTMDRGGEKVSSGNGAACLGDPLNALSWLARTARDFGEPLRAGQVVLSGALGPMVDVRPGDVVTAEITGLGTVTARFSGEDD